MLYQVEDSQAPQYAGQTITCTQCQKPFTVPANFAMQPGAMPPPAAPIGYRGPAMQTGPQQPNGIAIAALVCGILGFVIPVIGGLLGVIFGIIGINRSRRPNTSGFTPAVINIVSGQACR